jgi:hypothetical protein
MGEEIELEGLAQVASSTSPIGPARPRPHWRPRYRRRRRFRRPRRRPRARFPVSSHRRRWQWPSCRSFAATCAARGRGRARPLRRRPRQRFRGRRADAGTAAGDDGDLARQRLLGRLAELRLFERPIFDIEHVGFGDRLIAADGFGVGDHFDGVLGDVGRDGGVLRDAPSPNSPCPAPARRAAADRARSSSARAALLRAK